jgi:hypothetical protein
MNIQPINRVFKTARFSKDAKKAKIKDRVLYDAIGLVMAGQGDDLGGGVFKKRLNDNLHRSIILAKGGKYWIFEFLYAKKRTAPTSATTSWLPFACLPKVMPG